MTEHVNPRAVIGDNQPPLAGRLALDEAALVAEVQGIADRANQLPRKLASETADADIVVIGEVVRDAIALAKRVEARRTLVKAPWLEGGQTVDAFFRAPAQRLTTISTSFEKLVGDWREEQRRVAARAAAEAQRKAQQEEAQRRRAAEEAAARGRTQTAALETRKAEEAARGSQEAQAKAAAAAAPVPPQPVKAAVSDDLTMQTKGEWVGAVLDRSQIDYAVIGPYLKLVDVEDALKRAVKAGVRACRGAEIRLTEKVSFR